MPLTDKQARFVEEYLVDLNATQAAIRAGYSAKTASEQGHQLLQKTSVAEAIAVAQAKLSEKVEISQEWVLTNLKKVADRCMQSAPVLDRKGLQVFIENEEGDVVPAYTFNAMGANRSLELLGKHLGMFAENVNVNLYEKQSIEELRASIARDFAALGLNADGTAKET